MKTATFLPYRLDRLRLYQGGTVAECRLRLQSVSPRSLVAAFQILGADGVVLAEIDGFRFQHATLKARRPEDRFFPDHCGAAAAFASGGSTGNSGCRGR